MPECGSIRVICAGASGSTVTSNESSGQLSPSPKALMKASLRVQHAKNPSRFRPGGNARREEISLAVKKLSARWSASGISRISSTSIPTGKPRAKAYRTSDPECERLNSRCVAACAIPRFGLPCSVSTSSMAAGSTPSRSPRSRRKLRAQRCSAADAVRNGICWLAHVRGKRAATTALRKHQSARRGTRRRFLRLDRLANGKCLAATRPSRQKTPHELL